MITLENITVTYGKGTSKLNALKQVNLTIERGEFVTITGKSGCGKTTLLNIIGGILKPSSGNYYFNGKNVGKFTDSEMARLRNKGIGFVVQHFALINNMTIYENVALPLQYRKIKPQTVKQAVMAALEKVHIADKCNQYPYQLSGGEKQRTSIARAIAADTQIILADEPTGALDEENGHNIMNILKELNASGKTIIMVTHDNELAAAGTRRINIKDGSII